jgi:hypothetical protein
MSFSSNYLGWWMVEIYDEGFHLYPSHWHDLTLDQDH